MIIKKIKYLLIYLSLIIFLTINLINNQKIQLNLNIKIEKNNIKGNLILDENKNIFLTKKNIKNLNKKLNLNKKYILIKKNKNTILFINKKNISKTFKKKISGKITSNIKLTNDEIFITVNDNKILAIDPSNNKIKWQTITNANTFSLNAKSKLLLSEDKIYQIIPNSKLVILDKYTGEILLNKNIQIDNKKYTNNNKRIKKSIIIKNLIYICYKDGSFLTLDATTGDKIWQKTKNNYKNFFIIKNKIIITKKNGNITILNKQSGKKILTNRSLNGKKINIKHINSKVNIAVIKEHTGITHIISTRTGSIIYSFKLGKSNIKYISKNNFLMGIKNNIIFKIMIKN